MPDGSFWVRRGDKVFGPFSHSQVRDGVRSGKLVDTDKLAVAADGPWRTLHEMLPRVDQVAATLTAAAVGTADNSPTSEGRQGLSSASLPRAVATVPQSDASATHSPATKKDTSPAGSDGKRPLAIAWLAYRWYQLPARIRIPFYLVVAALFFLSANAFENANKNGRSGRLAEDIMMFAFAMGSVALLARFYICDYCLPAPGGTFYLRDEQNNVTGPFPYEHADEIVDSTESKRSNRISKDAQGPWLFWLGAFIDEKNDKPGEWRALLCRFNDFIRRAFWWPYAICLILGVSADISGLRLPVGNPLAVVIQFGMPVAIAVLAVRLLVSTLFRCYARACFQDLEESKRKAEKLKKDAEKLARDDFLASGLFDNEPSIHGLLMQVQGISCRNTHADSARVRFKKDRLVLELPGGVTRTLRAAEIESVVIGGRGRFTTSTDDAWAGGGFGMTGAIKGALDAAALNYLTSLVTQKEHCECLVHIKWKGGEAVLLNTLYEPSEAWGVVKPFVDAISSARQGNSVD